MLVETFSTLAAAGADAIVRAIVVQPNEDGSVLVSTGNRTFVCDRLITGAEPLELAPQDQVLCVVPSAPDGRGVLVGRIGLSHAVHATAPIAGEDPDRVDPRPNELLLEARQQLTLRVGDGSITIRADGKILIKGTDLVSHAKRMNRIKGGAVSIN